MNKLSQILFMAVCMLFLSGCDFNFGKKENKSMPTQQAQKAKSAVSVSVFVAKKADEPIVLKYPAKMVSAQDVNIVAKVPGMLKKQYFKAGDMVKEGDILFLIEPEKYKAAYDIALANVELSKANLQKAQLDYNRALTLKKTVAISQKEFDAINANYKSANAAIQSAEAMLKNAEIDLSYTKITAPFSGILGDSYQDVGAYISMQNPNLVRLTKLDPLYAEFAIPDIDALAINEKTVSKEWIQKGANVKLIVNEYQQDGLVTFIDKVINKNTGSVDAKAIFDNKNGHLLPNSFGMVEMSGLYQKDGYKIPQLAIKQDLTTPFVFLVKDGKVAKAPVKIVSQTSEYAVISSGLEEGDKIIMDNFMKIGVGVPVKIVEGK